MTIHRVSVSLSEAEYTQLVQAAGLLGIKPTTAAHRSIKHGLVALSKEAQAVTSQLQSLQFSQQLNQQYFPSETPPKSRQTAEQAKESAKPKTNTQRKYEQRLAREQAKKTKKQKTARA